MIRQNLKASLPSFHLKASLPSFMLLLCPLVLLTTGCSKKADDAENAKDTASDEVITGYLIENADKYVELGDYRGMEVIRDVYPVTDEDVEGEIYGRLQEEAEWTESADPVEDGDLLTLKLGWAVDGGASGTEDDYDFELGMWEYGEEFDSQFYNHKAGDTLQFTTTFEDDIWQDDWAGNTVSFDIQIKSVQRPSYPELTEEYVKEKGYDSIDAYNDAVRAELESEFETSSEQAAMDNALQQAMALSTFKDDFPQELYDAVADVVHTSHELDAQEWGMTPQEYYEMFGITDEIIQDEIVSDVQTKLFVSALYKAEDMQLTQSGYQDYISYLLTLEDYAFYEDAAGLEATIGKENLIWSAYTYNAQKFLYEQAKITEEIFDYTLEDLEVPEDPDADMGEVIIGLEDEYLEDDGEYPEDDGEFTDDSEFTDDGEDG